MRNTRYRLRACRRTSGPMLAAPTFALHLGLSGCASTMRLPGVPPGMTSMAQPSVPGVRFWPDRDTEALVRAATASVEKERAWLESIGQVGPYSRRVNG